MIELMSERSKNIRSVAFNDEYSQPNSKVCDRGHIQHHEFFHTILNILLMLHNTAPQGKGIVKRSLFGGCPIIPASEILSKENFENLVKTGKQLQFFYL